MTSDTVHPRVSSLFLADRAEVIGNKLYLMGGYVNTIFASQFPSSVNFSVVLIIELPSVMAGQMIRWTLTVRNSAGAEIGTFSAQSAALRPPQSDESEPLKAMVAIPQVSLGVASPGAYSVTATVQGAEDYRINFRVSATPGQ